MSDRKGPVHIVSKRWKAFVSKLRRFKNHHHQQQQQKEQVSMTVIQRRRHSSSEISNDAKPLENRHVSMPAGPVSSALSPPPRPKRLTVHERSTELEDSKPFRSGTLGSSAEESLKERRRRRSPLLIPDDEQLTLSLLSEGDSQKRTVKMTPIADPSDLDNYFDSHPAEEFLAGLDRDKAQYDAVVARTMQQYRRPESSTRHLLPATPPPSSRKKPPPEQSLDTTSPSLVYYNYYPSSPNSVRTVVAADLQ